MLAVVRTKEVGPCRGECRGDPGLLASSACDLGLWVSSAALSTNCLDALAPWAVEWLTH